MIDLGVLILNTKSDGAGRQVFKDVCV